MLNHGRVGIGGGIGKGRGADESAFRPFQTAIMNECSGPSNRADRYEPWIPAFAGMTRITANSSPLKKNASSWTPAFAGVTRLEKPPIFVIPAKAGIQMSALAYFFNGLLGKPSFPRKRESRAEASSSTDCEAAHDGIQERG